MTIEPTTAPGEALWNEHHTYINKTAGDISRSYWKVDKEDILQEVWVFLWEKEEFFVSQNRPPEYVRVCIKNCALNYAQKQRNMTLLETDTFYYSQDEIKNLLPTFLSSYEAWVNASPLPAGSETMTKNDGLEIMLDIARAWDRLTEGQQDILSRRYQESEDFPDATDRKTLSRAIKRLMELLNQHKDMSARSYEGPGAHLTNPAVKRIQSNAAGISEVRSHE